MNHALDFCLQLSQAHATMNRKLDEELGTHHGLSFADFQLLLCLSRADGKPQPLQALAQALAVPLSALVRRIVPLEKLGMVQRCSTAGDQGRRALDLLPGGSRLLAQARRTADDICSDAVGTVAAEERSHVQALLSALSRSPALAV